MPQIRALKTFQGRHGLVRAGSIITVQDSYAAQLIRNGLAAMTQAPENKALPGAPENKLGNQKAGGEVKPSSASLPARRSRQQTQNTAEGGESSRSIPASGSRRGQT